MNAIEKRKCLNAARRARRAVERYRDEYNRANKDLQICADLEGLCAIASVKLFNELQKEGIKATIVEGDCHAFVMYKGYVIDVTAEQFGEPFIVCRPFVSTEWWEVQAYFKTVKSFIAHQKRVGWPDDQIAGVIL